MGLDRGARVVAGVDAAEPAGEGPSLLARFLDGALGEDAEPDEDEPRSSLADWIESTHPAGLRAFVGGFPGEQDDAELTVVVGVEVLGLWERDGDGCLAGPVARARVDEALADAAKRLAALGVRGPPRLHLVAELG